jgi:hypothetical protein
LAALDSTDPSTFASSGLSIKELSMRLHVVREHHDHLAVIPDIHQARAILGGHLKTGHTGTLQRVFRTFGGGRRNI